MNAPLETGRFQGETILKFYKTKVEPAVFASLNRCFPEFGWEKSGADWLAKGAGESHLKFLMTLTGGDTGPRAGDRVQCYANSPGIFVIHGGPAVTWTSYVMGATAVPPRGGAFVQAVRILCDKAGVEFPGRPLRGTTRQRVNLEELRTNTNRLLKESKALVWFTNTRGFAKRLIDTYKIGYSIDGTRKAKKILRFPIIGPNGEPVASRAGYYMIPGVSEQLEGSTPNGWAYGTPPGVYYAWNPMEQKKLLIVEGFKDLWAIVTLVGDDPEFQSDWLVVTGTSGTALPPEFLDPGFYRRFKTLYLGFDNDDAGKKAADRIIEAPGVGSLNLEIRIPKVDARFASSEGKRADWNDLLLRGTKADFLAALAVAGVRSVEISSHFDDDPEVDIQFTFHKGALYYPTEQHTYKRDPGNPGRILAEEKETVVIKSSGELLKARVSESITPGITRTDRYNSIGKRAVLRLMDNVMIREFPKPLQNATWRQQSWQKFIAAKKIGCAPECPTLASLFWKIHLQFQSAVWLPRAEDYTLISLGIIASYAQQIFDAVPMFLFVGEMGTGKSELGIRATTMGCNGVFLPKATASSFSRACDKSRGLTTIDDFEELGVKSRRNTDCQFDDIRQLLKISYKKETGYRFITEDSKATSQSVYGVKFINNTQGVDPIIASRMFKIVTRKIPENSKGEMKRLQGMAMGAEEIFQLRDDLHTWVFSNVPLIHERYRLLMADKVNRHDEIAAPLAALAQLSGDDKIIDALAVCLARRAATPIEGDLEVARTEAFYAIVRMGYLHISTAHFTNELVTRLPENYGMSHINEIPEHLQAHAVGKWLSNQPWIAEHVSPIRFLSAEEGRLRAYAIDSDELERAKEVLLKRGETVESAKRPGDFCMKCDGCSYRSNCSILLGKQRRQATTNPKFALR
jgi:hypothetical protein